MRPEVAFVASSCLHESFSLNTFTGSLYISTIHSIPHSKRVAHICTPGTTAVTSLNFHNYKLFQWDFCSLCLSFMCQLKIAKTTKLLQRNTMTLTVAVGGALSMVLKQLRAQWMYISWVSFLAWFVRLLCSNNQYNAGISNTHSNILYAQFNKMWPQSIVYCIVGAFYKLAKVLWIESAIKTKCPSCSSSRSLYLAELPWHTKIFKQVWIISGKLS